MEVSFHWKVLWFGLTGRVNLWMGFGMAITDIWPISFLVHSVRDTYWQHRFTSPNRIPVAPVARATQGPQDFQWSVFYVSPFCSGWTGHVCQGLLCWQYLQQQRVMYFNVKSLSPSIRKFLKVPIAVQVPINVHLPSDWQGSAAVKYTCEVIPLALTGCPS